MPKVLIYFTRKVIWEFLFFDTDTYENRAHVHVGKPGIRNLAKIWLEPEISVAVQGDFSTREINDIASIALQKREALLKQWKIFKEGKKIRIIKITE